MSNRPKNKKRKAAQQPDNRKLGQGFLFFTVLCTGAGILMLEVLGARIAGPFFGVSLYIWTALISVTLVSLSVGYWLGGRLCDHAPNPNLMYALILAGGLLVALIAGVDEAVLGFSYRAFSGVWRLRLGVLLGSLILFGPPLTLLGMVSPFALKLAITDLQTAGRTAGRLYAISTIGSVAGAIATGYFLIPGLGIAKTLFVITGLILLPAVTWFAGARRFLILGATAAVLLGAFCLPALRLGAKDDPRVKLLLKRDGLYGQIKVMDHQEENYVKRGLYLDGTCQTLLNLESDEPLSKYIGLMGYFLRFYPAHGTKLLQIGLGGGAIVKSLVDIGYEVDAVEIDPAVVEIAVEYFGLDSKSCRIINEDGRAYVRTTGRRYDVILIDAYGGGSIPFHLFSREAFAEIRSVLNPGGILGINIISYQSGPKSILSTSLFRTVSTIFPQGRAYLVETTDSAEDLNNILMFFSDTPFRDPDTTGFTGREKLYWERLNPRLWPMDPREGIVVTDNNNPVDRWSSALNEDWRQIIYASTEAAVFTF